MLICIVNLKENAQRESMEKKRAERERQKLEKEEKKKQQQGNASDTSKKLNKPEEEEDIIGNLMKEIRRGKSLRRRSKCQSGDVRPSRSKHELKQDDIVRLQKIYEQSITERVKEESGDTIDGQINGNNNNKLTTGGEPTTSDSYLLSANYRKDRTKSEAFAGMQQNRKDQIRHSIHYMPHYETTV